MTALSGALARRTCQAAPGMLLRRPAARPAFSLGHLAARRRDAGARPDPQAATSRAPFGAATGTLSG